MDFDFAFVLIILLLMMVVGIASFAYIYLGDTSGDKNKVQYNDTDWTVRGDVDRIINKESGTVCYVYAGGYKGGISCLPLDQTNISIGESQN